METATGRVKPFSTLSIVIPVGQTVLVDQFNYSDFISTNYNITIKDDLDTKHKALTLTISKKGSDVSDYIYWKTGDFIAAQINVYVSGSDVNFEVTNNEVNDLSLFYRKNKIGV